MPKITKIGRASGDRSKLGNRFNIGLTTGETDPLLESAFFVTPDYEYMESRSTTSAFVIGRTGIGKSAAFRHLRLSCPDRVILIKSEDLALPYISNNTTVNRLIDSGLRMEPFFRPLWERVFAAEIIHHRYQGKSAEARQQFTDRIRRFFAEDPIRKKALKHLDELTADFWCSTEERIERNIEILREQITSEGGFDGKIGASIGPFTASFGSNFGAGEVVEHRHEISSEKKDRIQHVINQSELPTLKAMMSIIQHHVLDSPQNFTYILIDDLDRYWLDDAIRMTLLRCLFEAVVDMAYQIPNLKILVALRTNIFMQLDYGSQQYGLQEEKIDDMILNLKWTQEDLVALLDQRVRAASALRKIQPPLTLATLLPQGNASRDPMQHLIDLTLMRPRDAIQYLNMAIDLAEGKSRLSWDHLKMAEQTYSEKRLRALRDEWKDPYFHIDKVLEKFRKKPAVMTWEELSEVLDAIAVDVLYEKSFAGTGWLQPLCEPIYQLPLSATMHDRYFRLINVFFDIGFLGIASAQVRGRSKKPYNVPATFYYQFDDPLNEDDLPDNTLFVIHPAFRQVLQITTRWVS